MAEDEGRKDDDTPADEEAEEDDEYEAPDKDTWSRTTESLTKANNEAKKWRLRAQGKDPKWKPPPPPKDEDEEDDEKPAPRRPRQPKVDPDAIRREAEEATLAKAKPGLVKAAAKDALAAAGLLVPAKGQDAAYQRAIRLFDMEAIDVDEDGDVSGVDDQVKAVKRDYPELFAAKGAKRVNAGAGSNQDPAGDKADTSANKLAALLGAG